MNKTEANDTQTLLRWVLELQTFEHRSGYDAAGYGRSTVTDTELLHAVTALADRSFKELGAGIGPVQAQADARTLLALVGDADPDASRDGIDDEDAVQAVEVPS